LTGFFCKIDARTPAEALERLKAEISVERLVESSGVELKAAGKDLLGRCPFHEAQAIDLPRRYVDKKYSFCDAPSVVVMEQLGVAAALAFDDDFQSDGKFVLLS
jgi:predicted nucleic acid-binding protein